MGAMVYGHLAPGTLLDTRYYAGAWNGSGRAEANDDKHMMYMGRLQWNFLGRDLAWQQSDINLTQVMATQPLDNSRFRG
jgi:phosphodiesterase/alkaline phosphatase D-like protein